MAKINWTMQALEELADIHAYLSGNSEKYAEFTIDSILESVSQLEAFPFSGRIVSEMNIQTIREIILLKYRIIYQIIDDKVDIIAIRHSSKPFSTF